MSNRSLKLSREGIKRARTAIKHKGWTQEELAGFLGCSTQPISKFFNGKTVERCIFRDICDRLNLNIQEVVDNSEDAKTEPDNKIPKNSIDINALVQEVQQRVRDNIVRQCGTIRVLDMSHPIVLNNIYTNVNILDKITGRRGKEIAELLQECRSDDFERFGIGRVTEKRVPGLKAVETYSNLIISGKPGAGKTTFLKHVAIQCISGECKSDTVPIFVSLKDFAESGNKQDLLDHITKRFQVWGVTYPQVTELLEHGRLLVLLDGLDEVKKEDTGHIIKEIRSLSDNYYNNGFVITCRIAAKEYTFENFTEVEVADFDNEQIETFVTKWFQSIELDLAKRFMAQLEEQKPIKELATNPLLLTLLCLEFKDSVEFPSDRAELYKRATNTLLRKWDAKRGITRDIVYKQLSVQRKEDLLSQIALNTFDRGDYFFKQRQVEQYIADYIQNLCDAQTDLKKLQLDSEVVLKSIEAQHGLLVERARGIYSFSHLTFQEYFTARAIVDRCKPYALDDPALYGLVSHIFDKHWRKVFLLAAEMLLNADCLLLLIKQQIDLFVASDEKVQQFLTWVNQKSCLVKNTFLPAAVRAFYLEVALSLNWAIYSLCPNPLVAFFEDSLKNELASELGFKLTKVSFKDSNVYLDLQLAYAFGDAPTKADINHFILDPELKHLLQKLEDKMLSYHDSLMFSSYSYNYEAWENEVKNLAEQLRAMLIKYRNIGHDWQFNEQQQEALEQYRSVNKLLIECLNSNCYVSHEVRSHIEDTLLLPFAQIEQ